VLETERDEEPEARDADEDLPQDDQAVVERDLDLGTERLGAAGRSGASVRCCAKERRDERGERTHKVLICGTRPKTASPTSGPYCSTYASGSFLASWFETTVEPTTMPKSWPNERTNP